MKNPSHLPLISLFYFLSSPLSSSHSLPLTSSVTPILLSPLLPSLPPSVPFPSSGRVEGGSSSLFISKDGVPSSPLALPLSSLSASSIYVSVALRSPLILTHTHIHTQTLMPCAARYTHTYTHTLDATRCYTHSHTIYVPLKTVFMQHLKQIPFIYVTSDFPLSNLQPAFSHVNKQLQKSPLQTLQVMMCSTVITLNDAA